MYARAQEATTLLVCVWPMRAVNEGRAHPLALCLRPVWTSLLMLHEGVNFPPLHQFVLLQNRYTWPIFIMRLCNQVPGAKLASCWWESSTTTSVKQNDSSARLTPKHLTVLVSLPSKLTPGQNGLTTDQVWLSFAASCSSANPTHAWHSASVSGDTSLWLLQLGVMPVAQQQREHSVRWQLWAGIPVWHGLSSTLGTWHVALASSLTLINRGLGCCLRNSASAGLRQIPLACRCPAVRPPLGAGGNAL